jgi:hypothetical protein
MLLSVWRTRLSTRPRPAATVSLKEAAAVVDRVAGRMALSFRLDATGAQRLEALREARRAMIREEWTLGLEPGEPSLADADFSAHAVHWDVPIGEQATCRQKLRRLVVRANRRLEDAAARPVS